ncbi:MAG: thioredoxin family protein [Candidatus Omnitrophota bacterium]
MKVKIFGKSGCAKCDTTKNKLKHFIGKWEINNKIELSFHDMDTVEGMAEGAYNDVMRIPTTIFEENDNIIARWDGEVPHSEKVKEHLVK